MYIFEMEEKDYRNFISKYDYRTEMEIKDILDEYLEDNSNDKIRIFSNITNEYINKKLDCYYQCDPGFKFLLSFEELNELFKGMSILELNDFGLMIKSIENKSKRTKLIYELIRKVYNSYGNVIMKKDIEDLSFDEVRYFLNHISSNSKEMYAIDCKSPNIEVTPEEFYNYYHNKTVKTLTKKYEGKN